MRKCSICGSVLEHTNHGHICRSTPCVRAWRLKITREEAEGQLLESRTLAQRYGCPPDINFRFWLFALATGAEVWENNADYCIWIQGMKYREASEAAGAVLAHNGNGFSTADQVDAYMAAGIPVPTPDQLAKARLYFASMPSRQDRESE